MEGSLKDRGIAQSGSALALGARCREFKSLYPDQFLIVIKFLWGDCSSAGRAISKDCDSVVSGCRGFEPHQSPQFPINSHISFSLSI